MKPSRPSFKVTEYLFTLLEVWGLNSPHNAKILNLKIETDYAEKHHTQCLSLTLMSVLPSYVSPTLLY